MNLIALMLARNEDWVIGASLRAALKWCDGAVVFDHGSTDRTAGIVADIQSEHPGRVHVLRETSEGWSEMRHRQAALDEARRLGATHCAVVDADEIITADTVGVIRSYIETLRTAEYLQVRMQCMWRSLGTYRVGRSVWANRFDLMLAFMDDPSLSWADNGYDHHCRAPLGSYIGGRLLDAGGVMHLQFAPWRRLVAKHARYKMLERIKYPQKPTAQIDRLYNMALDENGLCVDRAPAAWWIGHADVIERIDLDATPWHEEECRRLAQIHGREAFAGLNLFGIV